MRDFSWARGQVFSKWPSVFEVALGIIGVPELASGPDVLESACSFWL